MWAVLSDIHANLEALDAVLADVAKHPVSHIFCLGDLVGYGPNPVECLDKALGWDVTLLGDHELNAMIEPGGINPRIPPGHFWTRQPLEDAQREELWTFLAELNRSHKTGDFLLVHAHRGIPSTITFSPRTCTTIGRWSGSGTCSNVFASWGTRTFRGFSSNPSFLESSGRS